MPWVGTEYFEAYPGEADWVFGGMRVPRAWIYRNLEHSSCNVRHGRALSWCLSHMVGIYNKQALQGAVQDAPDVSTAFACEHCSEKSASRRKLKDHMRKAHRDVLLERRKAYEARRI
jgi:hypothetical protein